MERWITALLLLLLRLGCALGAMYTGPIITPFCKRLGCRGECEDIDECLCFCYSITAKTTSVTSAYFGELDELMLYQPYVHYLHSLGKLAGTIGPRGSAPFFYFSPNHTEIDIKRHFCGGTEANREAHGGPGSFNFDEWLPPDYKAYYEPRGRALVASLRTFPGAQKKPLLIVHNKFTLEWEEDPANFIDVPTLLRLFELLTPAYLCVYIRPHPSQSLPGFEFDHNDLAELDDFEQLAKANLGVIFFHDLLAGHPHLSFNELQLQLHAQASHYISVLGGNSVLASYFASINLIYAVKGHEMKTYGLDLDGNSYEYLNLYPRITPQGKGKILHMKSYAELLASAREHFLPPPRARSGWFG